jgi:hypothetical protein
VVRYYTALFLGCLLIWRNVDEQKYQLYELMTAIRKKELEENDPEKTQEN